jgi:hypothetical protein
VRLCSALEAVHKDGEGDPRKRDLLGTMGDKEQEATLPLLHIPEDIPDSQESLGIYLGMYVNPKEDDSKIFLNLCWVNLKPLRLHLTNSEWKGRL